MNTRKQRLAALLLALALLLSACGGGEAEAATMHLRRAEGQVAVADSDGEDVEIRENLGLYNGYGVGTGGESYAWIDLDEVKLTKLDQDSEIAIRKLGRRLRISVRSGSLFFHVTEPLEDEETMEIETSTLTVGIRGTCGWVEENGGTSRVYLLEGEVQCESGDETVTVRAGEMAEADRDGRLTVKPFDREDIPAYIVPEIEDDPVLTAALPPEPPEAPAEPEAPETPPEPAEPAEEAPEPEPVPTGDARTDAMAWYRYILSNPSAHLGEWSGDGTDTRQYSYTLVQLQPEDPAPTLLLRRIIDVDDTSRGSIALFYYTPSAGRAMRTSTGFSIGDFPKDAKTQSLYLPLDGDGLMFVLENHNGATYYSRRHRDGNSIESTPCEASPAAELDWHDVQDLQYLENWTAPEVPAEPEPPAVPTDGNRLVLAGTLGLYTADQIRSQFGIQGDGNWDGAPYYLFVLDAPQQITARNSDPTSGPITDTAALIDVSNAPGISAYVGQHLYISIDSSTARWPSDASLPGWNPRTGDVHILN